MNSGSGVAAVELDAQGPNYCIGGYGGEGTGGAVSIAQAFRFLSTGVSDVMIAGGSEACLTECVVAGFNKLPDMQSNDLDTMSRAFDKNSKGYVLGEAAGLLILETEDHAKARGADIYCELAGFAVTHGIDSEFVDGGMPTAEALTTAINKALEDSGVAKTDVSYVSAHGSGVPACDAVEAKGIESAFGDHAKSLKVSGIKNQLGNTLAAAGGLEAAVCAKMLRDGVAPGTARLSDAVTDGLDFCRCVARQFAPQPASVRLAAGAACRAFRLGANCLVRL